MKPYTAFGLCLCGCDQSRVDQVRALNSDEALSLVKRKNRARGVHVVALVEGWHDNQLINPVRIPCA